MLQWREAAVEALTNPLTWAPAAGAAVTGFTGLDDSISDCAAEETPLFGSLQSALGASDDLCTATNVGMLVSAVAGPGAWGDVEAGAGRGGYRHGDSGSHGGNQESD
jgi:hypothetical protein